MTKICDYTPVGRRTFPVDELERVLPIYDMR